MPVAQSQQSAAAAQIARGDGEKVPMADRS
jgi:hypothetical protein